MANLGNGMTITFNAVSLGAIYEVNPPDRTGGFVDVTSHASTTIREKLPLDLIDIAEFDVMIDLDPTVEWTLNDVQAIVVTYPDRGAGTSTHSATAFITKVSQTTPVSEKRTQTLTFQLQTDFVIT